MNKDMHFDFSNASAIYRIKNFPPHTPVCVGLKQLQGHIYEIVILKSMNISAALICACIVFNAHSQARGHIQNHEINQFK